MEVSDTVVFVSVGVNLAGDVALDDGDAEGHKDHPHGEFHVEGDVLWDSDLEHDDEEPYKEEGRGVTQAPEDPSGGGPPQGAVLADEGRDSDYVVGLEGMDKAQEETHRQGR